MVVLVGDPGCPEQGRVVLLVTEVRHCRDDHRIGCQTQLGPDVGARAWGGLEVSLDHTVHQYRGDGRGSTSGGVSDALRDSPAVLVQAAGHGIEPPGGRGVALPHIVLGQTTAGRRDRRIVRADSRAGTASNGEWACTTSNPPDWTASASPGPDDTPLRPRPMQLAGTPAWDSLVTIWSFQGTTKPRSS